MSNVRILILAQNVMNQPLDGMIKLKNVKVFVMMGNIMILQPILVKIVKFNIVMYVMDQANNALNALMDINLKQPHLMVMFARKMMQFN